MAYIILFLKRRENEKRNAVFIKEEKMTSQMLPNFYGKEIWSSANVQGLTLNHIIIIYILISISILQFSCKRPFFSAFSTKICFYASHLPQTTCIANRELFT